MHLKNYKGKNVAHQNVECMRVVMHRGARTGPSQVEMGCKFAHPVEVHKGKRPIRDGRGQIRVAVHTEGSLFVCLLFVSYFCIFPIFPIF
jgi:hypothetical protein